VDPADCSLEYRLKIIARLPFFRHLPPEAIAEINRLLQDRDAPAGKTIYFEGDPAQYLYLVAMGKVKLIRQTGTVQEVLLDILRGGEYFGSVGMSAGDNYRETAIAQTDCCILQISSTDFEKILSRYPEVTVKVLQVVGQRLENSQEIIKQLSVYSVEQRIAAALLRLADKLGEKKREGTLIQLPFSRQDLAAMTGTTVETVSRVMSRFSEEGWISTGRKWVILIDLDSLGQLIKNGAVN
jgi:CRP-like cAMP-binding protein